VTDTLDYTLVGANGLRFNVAHAGAGDRLALCLHGFPELAYSWRHQIPLLADLGYRVWAPDLRGYGGTDRPSDLADYALPTLVQDVVELIRVSEAREVVLLAHDWGAVLAWNVAMHHPDLLDRLVIMNLPHPVLFERELRRWRQLKKSWYAAFFQLPRLPEALLGARGAEAVGKAFTEMAVHKERFGPEVTDVYRRAAQAPGALTAMVNYYRGVRLAESRAYTEGPKPMVTTPTLMLWGVQDTALGIESTHGTHDLVEDLTLRYLPDASHWVQQDQPEMVNLMLRAWLSDQSVPEASTITLSETATDNLSVDTGG
jgi:pimeloyl-ACP methyl ester carboxylesterase